jgi:hypothetical protein
MKEKCIFPGKQKKLRAKIGVFPPESLYNKCFSIVDLHGGLKREAGSSSREKGTQTQQKIFMHQKASVPGIGLVLSVS